MARLSFDRYLAPGGDDAAPDAPAAPVPVRMRSIEEAVRTLPPLPTMMTDLLRELGSADADIGQLEERISRDPTLTTRLLRMANSAFYAPAAEVCSVGQALMILGLRTARNLVVATAMRAVMGARRSVPGLKAGGIFQHSIAVAVTASRLGRRVDRFAGLDEGLFVAGLLHDIGMVALAETYAAEHAALLQAGGLVPEAERAVLGIDHVQVGRMVHEHWKLPAELLGPILHHHDRPEALLADPLTAVVALADAHADESGWSAQTIDEEHPSDRRSAIAAALGLEVESLLKELEGLDREVKSFMGSLS